MKTFDGELTSWPGRLDAMMTGCGTYLRNHQIIAETSSTQDVARLRDAPSGTVIVAGEQTAGRGRFGRSWSGQPNQGVYMSLVLSWTDSRRLAIACAVGVVDGMRALCGDDILLGIKWPNDVLARGVSASGEAGGCENDGGRWKKICGVLVEQYGDRAIIGIGINVRQESWPAELAERAVSLQQLGVAAARIDVLEHVLPALDAALALDEQQLCQRFAEADLLTAQMVILHCAGEELRGKVVDVQPLRGLRLQVDGEAEARWCPADSTTLHDIWPGFYDVTGR